MRPYLTTLFAVFCLYVSAQESPFYKFGKVTPAVLRQKIYSLDSSAAAVVLSDVGEVSIDGNNKGWFSLITVRHRVVHILNKSAYNEATVAIPLYTNGSDGEKLEDLKASTYNLQDGKVVETKLDKASLFTEKHDKNWVVKKFTLPAVKEGSVVEFQYKVSSDYLGNVRPWNFQENIPRVWSEFVFSVPQFFSYSFIHQGYVQPFLTDKKERYETFLVHDNLSADASGSYRLSSTVNDFRWIFKDVPELIPESYTSAIKNHMAKVECQLVSKNQPLIPKDYRNTWTNFSKELMEADYFAKDVRQDNGWLSADVKRIAAGAAADADKARLIYQYVRDHFVCTEHEGVYANQSLKNTYKTGKGTEAEVNLLLTAMLRTAGLSADPVILSTTDNGYTLEMYPLVSRFNYVVTQVKTGDKPIYLDASRSHLGFGKLLPDCYNGHARVVNEQATPVYFTADSLKDRKVTALFLSKGTKNVWEGNMSQTPGYYESYALRDRIKADGEAAFFKEVQRDFGSDVTISEAHLDSLNNFDLPLGIKYAIEYNPQKEDMLYINPMFGEGYKKNPFKSLERRYPVEMPNASDETYILTMDVPDGYEVDELPKQIMVKLDEEGKSFFEYRIQSSEGSVSLRSRVKLDRAYYEPDEYVNLREFFNLIVKKHNEQIVFKKKK